MASTRKHCKTRAKPTSLHAAHTRPPTASARRARLHTPPAHPDGRASAPARHPSDSCTRPTAAPPRPDQPLLRAARAPGAPSTPSAARPSPTRLARLGHDSRRAPTARARRATSFSIVLSGLQTRGQATRCAVSWHNSRGNGAAHAARRRRDRVEIANLARAGSSQSRTYVPPSARSILEIACLASHGRCECGARAQKQAGGVNCDAGHEASTQEAGRGAAPHLAGAPAARGARAQKSSPWATWHLLGLSGPG